MSRRRRSARVRGFTLIECVASLVIMSISVPPMLWSVRQAHRHRVDEVKISRAHWIAAERLEDVIADRHCRGYAYVTAANYPNEASVAGRPGFTRSVNITETGPGLSGAGRGYKRVECSVGFTDGAGFARTLTLATVVTDYLP